MIPCRGRCLGAGDKKQAKHYAKMFILMAMLGLFCTNACLFFTIPYIARLFSLSDTGAQHVRYRYALVFFRSALSAGPPV